VKILHVISSSGFYGAENVVLNLLKMLKNNQDDPYLICLKSHRKKDPEVYFRAKENDISAKVVGCKSRFDFSVFGKIKKIVQDEGVDLIHAHGYKANTYSLIAAKISKKPIISSLHGWVGNAKMVKLYEWTEKLVVRFSDFIICASPIIEDKLKIMNISSKKIKYIPNCIDTDYFYSQKNKAELRNELSLDGFFTVGTVGRLSEEKGHIYLMKALKELNLKRCRMKLLIVGDGPLKDKLFNEAKELGIEEHVIFLGVRKDMSAVYDLMDVFVLPSVSEGLPLVLLEAMSMKIPVVATRVGAIDQVISEGEGVLVDPCSVAALTGAVESLFNNVGLCQSMGDKAREKVVSDFSLNCFSQNYMKVYESVCEV